MLGFLSGTVLEAQTDTGTVYGQQSQRSRNVLPAAHVEMRRLSDTALLVDGWLIEDRAGAPYCNNVQSPIATIQVSSIVLFRVRKLYVGNLPPMLAAFPDYPAPVVRNIKRERSIVGDIHQPLQLSFKDDRSRQRHHSERLT